MFYNEKAQVEGDVKTAQEYVVWRLLLGFV